MPFSISELSNTAYNQKNWENYIYQGFYPRIYDKKLNPSQWYGDFIQTYLERDVRQLINIGDLRTFHQFLGICAGRIGQITNFSLISNDIGVSYQTVKRWISILEASFIIMLLPLYFKNFNKRRA